jgi:hypothetical protein
MPGFRAIRFKVRGRDEPIHRPTSRAAAEMADPAEKVGSVEPGTRPSTPAERSSTEDRFGDAVRALWEGMALRPQGGVSTVGALARNPGPSLEDRPAYRITPIPVPAPM